MSETKSRFLSTFELHGGPAGDGVDGNSGIRVTYAGTPATILLSTATSDAPETFYWSLDDDGDTDGVVDFGKRLEEKLEAQFPAGTWTVQINGVDVTDATKWQGRVKYGCGVGTCVFNLGHADSTLDYRILGLPRDNNTFSSQVLWSDWVHRFGWYPELDPTADLPSLAIDVEAVYSSAGYVSIQDWGEFVEGSYSFSDVQSYFVRHYAAADSVRVSGTGGTAGDPNSNVERFVADIARSVGIVQPGGRVFYFYPDVSQNDYGEPHRFGPFRFPPDDPVWRKPLAVAQLTQEAGELWSVSIPIRTATGFSAL